MDRSFHILILEEDGAITELLTTALHKEGLRFYLHHTATNSEFRRQLRAFMPDLIVVSHAPPRCDAMAALAAARLKGGHLPFLMVCSTGNEATAMELMGQGATGYVRREHLGDLCPAVRRALRETSESLETPPPVRGLMESAPRPQPAAPPEKTDEKIREQARLLDLASDAILAWDMAGTIFYWNESATRLYGWSAQEALNQNAALLLQENASQTASASKNLLAAGRWNETLTHIARNGDSVLVDSRQTLLRDALGNPKSVLAINTPRTPQTKSD